MLLIIVTALIPAVILGWWIYQKDSLHPEPLRMLIKAFLYGVGSTFVTLVITQLMGMIGLFVYDLGSFAGAVGTALFAAALPEEMAKLLMLWLFLRNNPFYDEHYDGIVYAVSVGLGFAGIENLVYLLGYYSDNWVSVAFVRSLMAVPGHYAFAVIMGYYYSVYHFVDRSPRIAACMIGFPILAHGIYDALILTSQVDMALGGFCVIIVIFLLVKLHKFVQRRVVEQIELVNLLF